MRPSSAPLRILYYGVHDVDYPRNRRIRAYLEGELGAVVTVAPRARRGGRLARARADLAALLRGARGADVIVLSEFRLTHAPLVRLVSRLVGARVVVDGFVGLHETAVGDHGAVASGSVRARILALQDRLALASSDLFLIDTEVRAEAARASSRAARRVLALPVGAPSWAIHRDPVGDGPLRILYYGNYIPLHGLDVVVDALDEVAAARDFRVSFVGDGALRSGVEARVRASTWSASAVFLDPVPEHRLADLIAEADVVLGVFGPSAKAGTVIANKVWQGLSCGRPVVTQASPALTELPEAVAPLVTTTTPGDAHALAEALSTVVVPDAEIARHAARALEDAVGERFSALGDWLRPCPTGGVA